MALKHLTPKEKQFIEEAFDADMTPHEICEYMPEHSHSTIRRHLAETGRIMLKWHKTQAEADIIEYLASRGIKTLSQLITRVQRGAAD